MKKLLSKILLCSVLFLTAITQQSCVQRINVGHVGLKVNLSGNNRGVDVNNYVTGWVPYVPGVSTVMEYSIRINTVEYEDYPVSVKGGSNFTSHPKLIMRVIPTKAHICYNSFGTDDLKMIIDGFLHTIVTKSMGDVANKYTPDSLLVSKEQYEAEVERHIKLQCDSFGIEVSSFRANLVPLSAALIASIDAKQTVVTDNQKLESQKKSVQIAGEKTLISAILKARADSAEAHGQLMAAQFKAQANKELQASYTDNFVKVRWIEAWESGGAQVAQYQLGNTSMMMQMPTNK